jgi:hypothetical protein
MWKLNTTPAMGSAYPKSGECIRTFEGHKDFVLSVALTPDGNWVMSGSKDRGVQFWDPETGNAQLMLQGHKNSGMFSNACTLVSIADANDLCSHLCCSIAVRPALCHWLRRYEGENMALLRPKDRTVRSVLDMDRLLEWVFLAIAWMAMALREERAGPSLQLRNSLFAQEMLRFGA